jgi:hypothetical protein
MKRSLAYNRGRMHKNEKIEEYSIPELSPDRNRRKFTISKFSENLTAAHNHAEFK